jgi:hypothetical protein
MNALIYCLPLILSVRPTQNSQRLSLDGVVLRSYAKAWTSTSIQKRTLPTSASTASPWLLLLSLIGMLHWHGSMIEPITES